MAGYDIPIVMYVMIFVILQTYCVSQKISISLSTTFLHIFYSATMFVSVGGAPRISLVSEMPTPRNMDDSAEASVEDFGLVFVKVGFGTHFSSTRTANGINPEWNLPEDFFFLLYCFCWHVFFVTKPKNICNH